VDKFKPMLRVYVAGAYSASNAITVLENMRIGMRTSTEVLLAGFAPYSPWDDYHRILMLRYGESLSLQDFYKYSKSWLVVSDAVLIVDNPRNLLSAGTQAELALAQENHIPIFYSLEDLKLWVQKKIEADEKVEQFKTMNIGLPE
jgi:hypothetical protein